MRWQNSIHAKAARTQFKWDAQRAARRAVAKLEQAPLQWHCTKCGKDCAVRGMHSDCDGETSDMIRINSMTRE